MIEVEIEHETIDTSLLYLVSYLSSRADCGYMVALNFSSLLANH